VMCGLGAALLIARRASQHWFDDIATNA
jgi:hypothetical protein